MNTLDCQSCKSIFTTLRRRDTKYCEACRTNRSWNTWGTTERGRAMRAKKRRELREQVFALYGSKCQCCGEKNFEFLALDHVNGGGRQDRKVRNTAQIARDLIKNGLSDDFRVLCHNCNQSMGWYGGCPHDPKWKTA